MYIYLGVEGVRRRARAVLHAPLPPKSQNLRTLNPKPRTQTPKPCEPVRMRHHLISNTKLNMCRVLDFGCRGGKYVEEQVQSFMHAHVYIYIYIHICVHVYVYIYIYIYIHTYTHTYIILYILIYVCIRVWGVR